MQCTPVRVSIAAAWALAAVLAAPAVRAGEETCPYPTQECLDQMVSYWTEHGWLGVSLEEADGAMMVTKVVPQSPAEKAGFEAGDIFVAVNGVRYDAEDKTAMKALRTTMVPGAVMTYVVRRSGPAAALPAGKARDVELTATLGTIPRELLSLLVGEHMLLHARPAVPAAEGEK